MIAGRKLINGVEDEKYKTIKKQKKIDGRNQRSKERIVELLNSSLSTLTTARFVVLSFMVFYDLPQLVVPLFKLEFPPSRAL